MARNAGGYPNPQTFGVADRFSTEDTAASANNSPVSATGGTAVTLTAPFGATVLVIVPTVDIIFSEDSGVATYCIAKANLITKIELAGMNAVYLKQASGPANIYYYWVLVY